MQSFVLDVSGSIYQLGLSDRVQGVLDNAFGAPVEGEPDKKSCSISTLIRKKRSHVSTLRGMDAAGMLEIDEALSRIGLNLRRG